MTSDPGRRWRALFPADHKSPGAAAVGADLLARWAEPHRRYHNLTHLNAILTIVDNHATLATDPDAVRLAAWYHDAVYDPKASDNEERSAALAEASLPGLGVPADRVAEVARLVRLTAGHQPEPGDRNGALLADADLAILASPPRTYDAYTRAIREEYAHVPDEAFRIGRATILQHLLALSSLYRVLPEGRVWTPRAHANLRRELAAMLDV